MAYNVLPLAIIIALSFVVRWIDEVSDRLAFVLTLLLTVAAGRSEFVPKTANASATTLIDFLANSGYVIFAVFMVGNVAFDLEEYETFIAVYLFCALIFAIAVIQFPVVWIQRYIGPEKAWEERSKRELKESVNSAITGGEVSMASQKWSALAIHEDERHINGSEHIKLNDQNRSRNSK